MFRTSLSISLGLLIHGLFAQEPTTPAMRIEKSAPIEMKSGDEAGTSATPITQAPMVEVIGDVDVIAAPPACKEKKEQARLDCVSNEVLEAVRAKMDPAAAGSGPHSYPVVITFSVNQYGEMGSIRVEHTGSTDLPKKVNVALYALPGFVPAQKNGAVVGCGFKLTYPFEALFPQK